MMTILQKNRTTLRIDLESSSCDCQIVCLFVKFGYFVIQQILKYEDTQKQNNELVYGN